MVGSDEDLEAKVKNSDTDLLVQKQKLKAEQSKNQELEDELSAARKQHTELAQKKGTFKAEFEVESRI